MTDAAKHICSGTVAGLAAKVVEHPFDTIKVRVQTSPALYSGYWDCARRILRHEGFASYYRGLGAPLAGGAAENAVCFVAFAAGKELYCHAMSRSAAEAAEMERNPPLPCVLTCGLLAGAAVSHVLTPVELLKCNMQVQNALPPEKRKYRNALHCVAQMTRAGGVRALYSGHTATLAREVPGNAAWFGFYTLTKRLLTPAGQSTDDLPLWKLMFSGGVGGVSYWTAFFPADVVKTKMQVDAQYLKLGLWRGLAHCYKLGGVKELYRGWGITALRAFPANALVFSLYELCVSRWDDNLLKNDCEVTVSFV